MPGTIDVFKAALGNQQFLNQINQDALSQVEFIKTLIENQYTPQEIHESIALVEDRKVRSLLIIHLLSQKPYLISLDGEPLTDRLRYSEQPKPSRLNAWVHQLEPSTLTPELIHNLAPEAAVSILCSVPHFHQLTVQQVDLLLKKHLEENLITYWVKNFSSMPNAHFILAHLMNTVGGTVLEAIKKLNEPKKKTVLTTIIEHLNFFSPVLPHLSLMAHEESYLILASRLYLNGHHYQSYPAFIKPLILRLLGQKHLFSLTAIEQLFLLSDVLEREKIASHTAPLINRYIKAQAQNGDIALFYREGHLNSARMSKIIHAPNTPEDEEVATYLNNLFHLNPDEECPLIRLLNQEHKSISHFDYFLISYNGADEPLSQLVDDYLEYHTQQKNTVALHHLSALLAREELNPQVKNTLYSALLRQPMLHDEQISYGLLLYDVSKTIKYYGMQGGVNNYKMVLKLCALELKKLNAEENQDLIKIIQKAQYEANTELGFSKEQGIFSGFIKHIKRCWIYGWTGFFTPNLPLYVLPESVPPRPHNLKNNSFTALEISKSDAKMLPALLQTIELPLTQEQFDTLEKAHALYSLKDPVQLKEEFKTRLQLHNLYLTITPDNELYPMLIATQGPFVLNHFRLLELALKTGSAEHITSLVKQIDDNHKLKRIADELNGIAPQQKIKEEIKPTTEMNAHALFATAKDSLSELATDATYYAVSGLHWAESFFFTSAPKPNDDKNLKTTALTVNQVV
ncbi:MAG: hypothetical protein P4L65_00825 [Legionella sp.]|nr:hypothetical protein [Legionella sp.]